MMDFPFPHDTTLDGPEDDEPEPREERDPDEARQQRLDDAWQFPNDDCDDGYEPAPRRSACIDRTEGRFRGPF